MSVAVIWNGQQLSIAELVPRWMRPNPRRAPVAQDALSNNARTYGELEYSSNSSSGIILSPPRRDHSPPAPSASTFPMLQRT